MKKDKEKKAVKEEEIDPEIAYEKAMEEKKPKRNWGFKPFFSDLRGKKYFGISFWKKF